MFVMIDPIQSSGAGLPKPLSPKGGNGGKSPENASEIPAEIPTGSSHRDRLTPITGKIEQLQRDLSRLGADAEEAPGLMQQIKAAQVALQNILSADGGETPGMLDSLVRQTAEGHALKPGIVLQLLE